jgi:hypothetical protein
MAQKKWNSKSVKRLLAHPRAGIELNGCIEKVYKELTPIERSEVDRVGYLLERNTKKKYGQKSGKFHMGALSYGILAIRLAILMIELNIKDGEELKKMIGRE